MSSKIGAIILQGPHQSAQKSTNTGPSALSTSLSNVASLTYTIWSRTLGHLLEVALSSFGRLTRWRWLLFLLADSVAFSRPRSLRKPIPLRCAMRLPLRNDVDVRTSARVIMPCFDSFSSASYRPEGALTPRVFSDMLYRH